MYIAYATLWSEGVVVVKDTDTKFPLGYDGCTGNVVYRDNLDEIDSEDIILRTEDIQEAANNDTAGYNRYGIDEEELSRYNKLVKEAWKTPLF